MKKVLLFFFFFLPFQFALNPAPGIDLSIARLFIVLAFFVWLIKGLIKNGVKISHNYITWGLLIFLSFGLLSFIKAEETGWAIRKFLVFLSIFPLYFLVSSVFQKKDFSKLSLSLIISSTIVGFLGILQFLSQFILGPDAVFNFWSKYLARFFLGESFGQAVVANPSWWVNIGGHTLLRATSVFPDPHMLSFFLGMILPLFIPLIIKKRQSLKLPWLYGFMASIVFVALILTFSRGGYIGLLVSGLWLLFYLFSNRLNEFGKKQKIGLVFIACILLLIIFFVPSVKERLFSSLNFEEGSVAGRLEIWHQAFSVWLKNFWLGVGIGNYSYYLNPLYEYRLPVYAHNTYLDIAVEMGIFGLIAWLSVFVYTFYKLIKLQWLKVENFQPKAGRPWDERFKVQSAALIASLMYFSAHALFDTPIYSPQILPLLIIILGLTSIMITKEKT
ncbi:MAG: O-antigen ligase family protein [Candidatus Paceibacterota bacterium]|jgi:O-antigen ligase